MRWVVVDVVVALLALGVLVLAGLGLWHRVTALGRAAATAGERLEQVAAQLEQVGAPPPDAGRPGDVRSAPTS